jgi:hypothetical protein
MFRKPVKLLVCFLSLLLTSLILSGQKLPDTDSTYFASLLQIRVNRIIHSPDSSIWVIAGENNEDLYKITSNGIVHKIDEEFQIPSHTNYSDVLSLQGSNVLIATSNDYLYFLRNRKKVWINAQYGLSDSAVRNLEWDSRLKLVSIKTSNSRFLVYHPNRLRNFQITEIQDTVSTMDEISYFLKQNFRLRIQKGICTIASDIDLSFRKQKYINETDLEVLNNILIPGDLIIKRNDSQLANVGIPGFWTHSAIFIGGLEMLDSLFKDHPMLDSLTPREYISENYPEMYQQLLGRKDLIIEGIAEGVLINPVEHIAMSDYLAVIRPQLPQQDIFKSILSSFDYLGAPYDFLFDFSNDNEVVCSELIYNAFKPSYDKQGIIFTIGELSGRPFLSPTDLARQCCKEMDGSIPQMKLVFFYDAEKEHKKAIQRNGIEFCKTLNNF